MNNILTDFNLTEEGEDTCELCKTKVPSHLNFIEPYFVGDSYKDLCPKCALGVRNLLKNLPRKAKYPGDSQNERYYQYISWTVQNDK